eukprot:CAMPEP_0202697174 /NCGR_PEP_ID=MMETSP1385-20130828/10498_1 /ASSEMBLY_ACC=CAM_ASM_000861 /TAXON_ID=933848 /ORGANISM="Elphidium margaritaceum" /LENGTH=291 /DNA_ID=CAMNT_0049353553 /DNA_START=54 /DNA_END=929 /DNA_ORIENTATION=-
MNDEDSSDESEDNIVLDQSLTVNVASSKHLPPQQPLRPQVQQPPIATTGTLQSQQTHAHAQPAPPSEHKEIKPTIVTIVAPTLKSNKAANVVANANAATEAQSRMLPPPPIPFHSQLNAVGAADANRNVGMLAPQSQSQQAQPSSQVPPQALADNSKEEMMGGDKKIDPRVLKMMSDGANGSFFDLDLDCLTDKPWTDKNADITDWFNYGFNEATWKQYIRTQSKMREALSKQHIQQTAPSTSLIPQIILNHNAAQTAAQYHQQPNMSVVSSLMQQPMQQPQPLLHQAPQT